MNIKLFTLISLSVLLLSSISMGFDNTSAKFSGSNGSEYSEEKQLLNTAGEAISSLKEDPMNTIYHLKDGYFIENKGQIPDRDIKYYSENGDVRFLPDKIVMRFKHTSRIIEPEQDRILDLSPEFFEREYIERGVILEYSFLDPNDVSPTSRKQCSWNTNYFRGDDPDRWYTDLENCYEVLYPEIWDGIDVVFKLDNGEVKYDIIVSPGSDIFQIGFEINGCDSISTNSDNELLIKSEYRTIIDRIPIAYYEDNGEEIDIKYNIISNNQFGYELPDYDKDRKIVIDPLVYSTYLGGSDEDFSMDMDADQNGCMYLTGYTADGTTDFPVKSGSYDILYNGGEFDVFATKINSNGTSLLYSTFLGGSDDDKGQSILIDSKGNAYITGVTKNSTINFPVIAGSYDTTHNGYGDIFVTKLSSKGNSLIYSTFIGGSSYEIGYELSLDQTGNLVIAGAVQSSDYPTTPDAYDRSFNGHTDISISCLNPLGKSISFSTFLGGSGIDVCYGMALDPKNNIYVAGGLSSVSAQSFPVTDGAYDTTFNGQDDDIFVSSFNQNCSILRYSTFLGGNGSDKCMGIDVDQSGNSYLTGYTYSKYFPTTEGAYDTTLSGGSYIYDGRDAFLTKLNETGSSLVFSTFLGGTGSDLGMCVYVNSTGYSMLSGYTYCSDFPVSNDSFDSSYNGESDVFYSIIVPNGSSLTYSTYIGGSKTDRVRSMYIGELGNFIFSGYTQSTDYPVTSGSNDTSFNGVYDVIITNLHPDTRLPEFHLDTTNTTGTTGEDLVFEINVTDNLDVRECFVEYWYGFGAHINISLLGTNPYSKNITLPWNSTNVISYEFHAVDVVGNWNKTRIKRVIILDNDPPSFGANSTDNSGTTGDTVTFSIQVSDNIDVEDVYVEYWQNTMFRNNMSMVLTQGTYDYSTEVPTDNISDLHYLFRAVDEQGNWVESMEDNIIISDNDPPIFGEDLTADSGTTGDPFRFEIEVSDNIELEEVLVSYWFGSGDARDIAMSNGSGTYFLEIMIPSDVESLHYYFYADDTSDNTNETDVEDVTILDNDRPVFGSDTSDAVATTGDEFRFEVEVADNIEIADVRVEYWFGSEPHNNVSMEGDGSYLLTIVTTMSSLEPLHYIFHSIDTAGNWNHTSQVNLDLIDNDLPVFLTDYSDESATTGDEFTFDIDIIDNIEISGAYVEYWFSDGDHQNESMEIENTNTLTITIPSDSLDELHYIFRTVDSSGNWNHTDEKEIEVTDNDGPVLISGETPDEAFTGDDFLIKVTAEDNIFVEMVEVVWRFGTEGGENSTELELDSGYYEYPISIPIDSIDPLIYKLLITDTSGNTYESDETTITVTDTISPTVDPVEDITIYQGQELNVTVIAEDNIGIVSYSWEGAPIEEDDSELKGTVTDPGEYEIIVTILDEESNTNSISFKVTVLSEDYDTDSDGIPDLVEMEWGLSKGDPSDGEEDADSDGLRNYQEFANRTKPFVSDTDDDGMLDGWEVQYGLDPTTPSAYNDEDGDGKTDIDEFLDGTDPLVKEKEDDDGISPILIIIPIILILIGIGIGAFLAVRNKKNKEEAKSENPDITDIQNDSQINPDEVSNQENTDPTYP